MTKLLEGLEDIEFKDITEAIPKIKRGQDNVEIKGKFLHWSVLLGLAIIRIEEKFKKRQ